MHDCTYPNARHCGHLARDEDDAEILSLSPPDSSRTTHAGGGRTKCNQQLGRANPLGTKGCSSPVLQGSAHALKKKEPRSTMRSLAEVFAADRFHFLEGCAYQGIFPKIELIASKEHERHQTRPYSCLASREQMTPRNRNRFGSLA